MPKTVPYQSVEKPAKKKGYPTINRESSIRPTILFSKHPNMLLHHIQTHPLLAEPGTSLLAVSGGVDSVTLVDLFARAQYPFAIAHANFGLRGQASEKDATLVKQLAKAHKVPYHTKRFDLKTYAKNHKVSIQMAARTLRYNWFAQLIGKHQYLRIVTAHHHQDQVETILRNLIKGTGIVGMGGMPAIRGPLIRPLLSITKEALIAYARQRKLKWREDASNQSTKYDRNQIRHKVIPLLKTLNPSWENTMQATIKRLQDSAAIFHAYSAIWKAKLWKATPPYIKINYTPLAGKTWAPTLLASWLAPFGFTWHPIQRWWQKPPQTGKKIHSPTHWLLADRNEWVLGPNTDAPATNQSIDTLPCKISLANNILEISAPYRYNNILPKDTRHKALLDYQKLTLPLVLRSWQPGDRFCPIGMGTKHKKIRDFLVDVKIPTYEKAKVLVITSAGQIVWVVGHRIDERFKITQHTTQVIACTLTRKNPTK